VLPIDAAAAIEAGGGGFDLAVFESLEAALEVGGHAIRAGHIIPG
jgi:hypothetical protein